MNTAQPLNGRHALVTGGSRGIGFAVAQHLAGLGARVTLMGRDAAALKEAASRLAGQAQIGFVCADVAQRAQVLQAFDQARKAFGAIDILVNNAGQAESQRFDRVDEDAWQRMIAVNLSGTFHCMQAALPDMLEGKWGRIVNVASTAGLIGYAYVSAYCAAKHGVVGLTRALAQEVARKGVTVNAVCPGYTETDIVHGAIANIVDKTGVSAEQARATLAQRNPQGRLVQPADVAQAVAWLCLPAAESINGQALPVDGGEVMAG
jgi:3-hydroxybutyrate dehydrogenase